MRFARALIAGLVVVLLAGSALAAPPIPMPEEFLGFVVGTDRKLADYEQIAAYFHVLDEASDRLELLDIGDSAQGRDLWMAAISSPENLSLAARHRDIARKLADPRGLSDDDLERLVAQGKTIVLVTCQIHSTEVASSQMAMELAWYMTVTDEAPWRKVLDDVILLLVPSINPDGTQMVADWYRKYVGTEYEGGRMPWLYHHYAGHDNNRDWFMLNLPETRAVNRVLYHDWFPQVYLDIHQMGSTGPRMFVPPFQDPIGVNVHPLIWRLTDLFGTEMAVRLQEAGRSGVIDGFAYDGYWPGGTMNTAWWKNVVGLLTESASARLATPVRIEENELRGGRKGLAEYRKQVNFPDPWPGGWWHLRDIVDYQIISTGSLLETAAHYREDLLRDMARMARDAVQAGASGPPYAYLIPPEQRDPMAAPRLAEILMENAVEVHRASAPFEAERRRFPAGTLVVRMDQPYRAFAKELLEVQRFPEVRPAAGEEILPPYDVTGWTLPLMLGVDGHWLDEPLQAELVRLEAPPYPRGSVQGGGRVLLLRRNSNASVHAVNLLHGAGVRVEVATSAFSTDGERYDPGTYVIRKTGRDVESIAARTHVTFRGVSSVPDAALRRLPPPRVGLYKPWTGSMDEGWTRLVLEQNGFAYVSLANEAVRKGDLDKQFDAIILPDQGKDLLLDGKREAREGEPPEYRPAMPPEYSGGLGNEGADALQAFVEAGGTLITLDSAGELALDRMKLPVNNVLEKVPANRFLCPGSLLRILVDPDHPLGYGLPEEVAGYFSRGPAYATSIPGAERTRQVVARYPADGPVLLSGWIRGEDRLRRRAAVVEVGVGKGRVVLLGFRVQHRSQPEGTFRLLFNALELAAWEDPS